MPMHRVLSAVLMSLLLISLAARAQVDPTTAGTQPPALASDATADSTQTSTDATDTTATDATGTEPTTTAAPLTLPVVWRLHLPGVELETEAWLLPFVAFVVSLLLAGILHWVLVARDVAKWPKLRLLPFLLAAAILVATYFSFVRGLDEELLRIAGPRLRLWLYIYGLAVFVLWLLLPRPKVPTRAKVTA